jgi:ribonuclease Z
MVAEEFSLAPGEQSRSVISEGGLEVTAFVVDHSPVEPVVGYRFDYAGRSAVISGDTVHTTALVDAAAGADLLVHDGLSIELLRLVQDAAGAAGLVSRQQILADITDYHATPAQAADAAREAGVGALAITHIVPPLPLAGLEEPFLGDARERFDGPLWLARDGDLDRLPAGRSGVERTRLFR